MKDLNMGSKKRGKGSKEALPARSRHDPSDLGDPRGTRAPADSPVRPTDVHEKGDERRPYRKNNKVNHLKS